VVDPARSPGAEALDGRRLYLCTADRPDLEDFLEQCIRGGVDIVQLRDKHLEARDLIRRAELAGAVCAGHGVPFVLNDRPDLALAARASGVHVGQDDTPARVARQIVGPDAIVGLSTHAPSEWAAAEAEPADYLSGGPVNPTPTKPGRPGTGIGYLKEVASTRQGHADGRPWFVTGGVTPDTIPAMAAAGARRFVVVRYLTESDDPEAAARALLKVIDQETA